MFAAYITVYIIEISSGFRAKPQVFIYVFLGSIPVFTGHIPEFYGHISHIMAIKPAVSTRQGARGEVTGHLGFENRVS